MTPSVALSTLLGQRRFADRRLHCRVGADWLQGRSAFGGLVAALGVVALRDRSAADGVAAAPLRALQTSFVAPVGVGEVEVTTQPLRQGRSARQAMATLRQRGQVCAVVLAVFAGHRPSALEPLRPRAPADVPGADALPDVPYRADAAPPFLQHFDLRWAAGPPPYSGTPGLESRIYLRLGDAERETVDDELLAVLLADVAPTPPIGQLRQHVAASSVTWALELRTAGRSAGDGWWRADTEALAVDGGLVNQSARLWTPDGALAALGTQLVAVFG